MIRSLEHNRLSLRNSGNQEVNVAIVYFPVSCVPGFLRDPSVTPGCVGQYKLFRERPQFARPKMGRCRPPSIEIALGQIPVGIDPPIAQKWPVRAHHVDAIDVALDDQRFLAVVRGPR